jgi:hypothetical protein
VHLPTGDCGIPPFPYIGRKDAWGLTGRTAGQKLMAEAPKFTTLMPYVANLTVMAAY